jgi:ATP-dependent DNA ligase
VNTTKIFGGFTNYLYICSMKYTKFQYIYPPRPKNAIPSDRIGSWDNGTMIAQPKLNGSNCLIFTDGKDVIVYNRHNQRLTNYNLSENEVLSSLYRGEGWMVINGEYLNKAKNDETGGQFNHKLVIFDIIVLNGDYLVGTSFEERVKMLDNMYGTNECSKPYLFGISDNIYRVKSFTGDFVNLFDELTKIDMVEGMVMKRANAKLELGTSENNNTKSQIKARKACKNFKF